MIELKVLCSQLTKDAKILIYTIFIKEFCLNIHETQNVHETIIKISTPVTLQLLHHKSYTKTAIGEYIGYFYFNVISLCTHPPLVSLVYEVPSSVE